MNNNIFQNWLNSSYLIKSNQAYIDEIYKDFLKDPNSVDFSWHKIFRNFGIQEFCNNQSSKTAIPDNLLSMQSQQNKNLCKSFEQSNVSNEITTTNLKVLQLINFFRKNGHQDAILDPLGLFINKFDNDFLKLEYYKFTKRDLAQVFNTASFGLNKGFLTLKDIYKFLKNTYCNTIGIEYMHILDIEKTLWIQNYFESNITMFKLTDTEQKQFLKEVIEAEELEHYLGIKFPGMKRFSLEGGDVLIPMLKEMIRYSVCNYDIQEIFFGMAHRGRLNVLVNILGKKPQNLFNECSGERVAVYGSGDVKYHQGLYSKVTINSRNIDLFLLPNPSHLEIITPVVMGAARSRIDQLLQEIKLSKDSCKAQNKILPIIIHGDAAVSAQGVVQESLNMSNTYAYSVGGTIHLIINNQIGFTTSDIYNIRSTFYCTDIVKMIQAPVLHVNADDVNAVIFVTKFALDFRNKFNHDIVIDLICYRRHGHNESDEPSVTQPIMYKKIRNHPTVTKIYSNILKKSKIIDTNEIEVIRNTYRKNLITTDCLIEQWKPVKIYSTYYLNDYFDCNKNNNFFDKIDDQYLKRLSYRISEIPLSMQMHDRVKKIYHGRIEMSLGKRLFDWGGAEILAYAVLLDKGYSIRLSGEDVARGTFFHRHTIIHDQINGSQYIPLMHIKKGQGLFSVWDSVLSEESTLAFEYGYSSIASKNTLVIWEAQFGDFSNGAQVVIDQFISAGEQKWNQLSGLVMLLPHGYEGQGPEHSSCRLERYLQLCAENNIKICIPSTPAQIYHVIHQHANNSVKKPLIIVSPKSLLRHPMVTSSIKDLAFGSFKNVLNETNTYCVPNRINRVIMCTGKVYYDLIIKRDHIKLYNIAIIRIEQLYPFPNSDISKILQSYSHVKDFVWCQEEPKNQGAWNYIQYNFYNSFFNIKLNYVGRSNSASPASGYLIVHQKEQKKIINDALNLN